MTFKVTDGKQEVVIICAEPDAKCEGCGKVDELRPYGKDGQRICFDCAQLPANKPHVEAAMVRLFGAKR